jgi:hypothetical protein
MGKDTLMVYDGNLMFLSVESKTPMLATKIYGNQSDVIFSKLVRLNQQQDFSDQI